MTENPNVFEGVEKRIEVSFSPTDHAALSGLRGLSREILNELCARCGCEIIHHKPTDGFDSYILSESALFVYPYKVVIKTCGTTLPLNGLDYIVRKASAIGLLPSEMVYGRTNFMFPDLQLHPHTSLETEIDFLRNMKIDGRVVPGISSILGDPCGKYWLVHRKQFNVDQCVPDSVETPDHRQECISGDSRITVDVIMTGLCPQVCKLFFKDPCAPESLNENTMGSAIKNILPEFKDIQGKCYNPCGYSANGHQPIHDNQDRCFTVHVTPEQEFSYASFEAIFYQGISRTRSDEFGLETDSKTMARIEHMIRNVLSVFNPDGVFITIMSSNTSVSSSKMPGGFVVESDGKTRQYVSTSKPYTSENLLGEDIVASSIYYSGVSSGNTGTKPTGLS